MAGTIERRQTDAETIGSGNRATLAGDSEAITWQARTAWSLT